MRCHTFSVLITFLALGIFLTDTRQVQALPLPGGPVRALPAFARKYGLPCSSCHQAWPMLSPFGQAFKDNGYQLGNERDAPVYQNPAYWPVTFRITPIWHRENENRAPVDGPAGVSGNQANVTTDGFDLSGLDFHTGGTLAKNVSFYVLPSSDPTASFHFETVMARLDNLAHTSWLNIKLGKFELDNLLSEKRILTLTNVSGVYTNYHFQPATENSGVNPAFFPFVFGIGDNQLGMEVMGHSADDRTRYSVALLSSNDGNVNLPTSRSYGTYITASQAFQVGGLGLQRIGVFDYIGEAPTYYQYTNGNNSGIPGNAAFGIPGTGIGNRSFYRAGLIGQFYIKKYDLTAMYFHSSDDKYLATGTPANPALATVPLAAGAQSAIWNGALFESHYTPSPQFILIQRVELVRMSQQALPIVPGTPYTPGVSVPSLSFGNEDVFTFGGRYYPFISSRAGFAFHGEYAFSHQTGTSPITGQNLDFSSLLFGFDFAF
ncbi:MAG TPA: hypothetical protein VJW94_04605 [Candidatus Acidoferrum sp.]|nr:hypothetical protein [Candidatus Acidoferrum sp.]